MGGDINMLLWLLLLPIAASQSENTPPGRVIYMTSGTSHAFYPNELNAFPLGGDRDDLRIYCFLGKPESLLRIFESVELKLSIKDDDYTQYEGETPLEVREHYDSDRSLFSLTLFSQKRSLLQLSPFKNQCIGISTQQPYSVYLNVVRVDFWRVVQLTLGMIIFFNAGRLSNNTLFYYISGILIGICASFLLLIFLAAKLFPKRPMMYGMLIGGWTVGVYLLKIMSENLQLILVTYREYVFWYLIVTSLVSFFICYRFGTPRNRRSKNIIKWVLQLLAMWLIHFSSRYSSATVAIIMIVVAVHYFPRVLFQKVATMYRRRFPQRRRLLTLEEYYRQGVEETNRSLQHLREYVNSPNCSQWKVISALRDPMRFADFANGAPHLKDEELEQHSLSLDDSDTEPLQLDEDYIYENNENDFVESDDSERSENVEIESENSDDSEREDNLFQQNRQTDDEVPRRPFYYKSPMRPTIRR